MTAQKKETVASLSERLEKVEKRVQLKFDNYKDLSDYKNELKESIWREVGIFTVVNSILTFISLLACWWVITYK